MKPICHILVGASAASLLACASTTYNTPNTAANAFSDGLSVTPIARADDQLNDAAKSSDIIGMSVNNVGDEKLGTVDDVAVDVESGRIVQVIVSTGGFIGIGDRLTAVPPEALHRDLTRNVLHLDADAQKLKAARRFEMAKWADGSEPDRILETYRYYGQERYLTFVQTNDASADRHAHTANASIPASRLSHLRKGSELIGIPVKNLHDEKLGNVENLLLDLPAGRIVAVVISSGGYLGMEDELSAVPPTALRFTADRETLQLDVSKVALANAPHFDANQWPDFAQANYSTGVYRAYRVEPYFTNNGATRPNTAARTPRAPEDRTPTPVDRPNTHSDTDITAHIRREIIATKDMSRNGRNVRIITDKGQVTLRGPVNTVEERRLIGEIADRIVGREHVDNLLEVTLSGSHN